MPTHRPTVLGLGEILWDLLPAGKQLGGAPANFAFHAQQLGAASVVVSCVGDDDLGREILDRLDALRLTKNHVAIDAEHPTGTVGVEFDASGHPAYVIHEPVAWDFIPLTGALLALAARADAVCFGTLAQRSPMSRATIRSVLEATRPQCLRVFDVNLRQHYYDRDVVRESLAVSSVLKLNEDELPVVLKLLGRDRGGDVTDTLHRLRHDHGLRLVALTRGAGGSLLVSADAVSDLPGTRVKVVDTVGAGDAFIAAVVTGLLRGNPLKVLHARAARVAAYVCTKPGATPQIPAHLL